MVDQWKVEIEGVQGLLEKLARLRVPAEKVEDVLFEGAKIYEQEARARAPLGETGNLRKSIKAKRGRRRGADVQTFRTVFTATDFHVAPHDHLVEFGHDMVKDGSKKRGGKVVGRVQGKPFFRPAVYAKQAEVEKRVIDGLNKLIEEAVK